MGLFYLLTVGGGELGDLCPLKSTEVTSSLASHGSWGLTEGGEERGSGSWDTCSNDGIWAKYFLWFGFGILSFLNFLVLGQVLVLITVQEERVSCLCLG